MDREPGQRERHLREQLVEIRNGYEDAIRAPRERRAHGGESFLGFEISGSALALPVSRLMEALPSENLVRVPCGPTVVAGALAYRQEILAVFDLATALGLGAARTSAAWVLALRPLELRAGVLADRLLGIFRVPGDQVERLEGDQLSGQFVQDGRPVAIPKLSPLLSARGADLEEGP